MKKIGFIGAYDKADLILYVAKMLTSMGNSVLIIDATAAQKTKYIVPVINPTTTYFTEFEDIDVAVGFDSMKGMLEYLGHGENVELDYDYVLIDVDSDYSFDSFSMQNANSNYFVTSFDVYSLKKGLEALGSLLMKVKMHKVIFSRFMSKQENEYLDFLSKDYNVEWENEVIYFPLEQGDQTVIIDNQRASKIKTKFLSAQFKQSLMMIASQISGNTNFVELKKILKNMDKGV